MVGEGGGGPNEIVVLTKGKGSSKELGEWTMDNKLFPPAMSHVKFSIFTS